MHRRASGGRLPSPWAAGAEVAIAARRADRLEELHKQLVEGEVRASVLDLDVASEEACRAAVQDCVDEFGALDVLVNNAGVMLLGTIEDADTEDWRRMMDVNVLGLMYMTHAALPHLLASRGTVVNVSSVAGRIVSRGSGVYNASKWAVNAFSESCARKSPSAASVSSSSSSGWSLPSCAPTSHKLPLGNAPRHGHRAMRQLQSEDIAAAVVYAATQPDHVAVNEILIRPTDQPQ